MQVPFIFKKIILRMFILFTIIFTSCQSDSDKKATKYPNESSELAQLMRDLADEMASAKKDLNQGKRINLSDYSAMKTAEATKPEVPKTSTYQQMTDGFLAQVQAYNESEDQSKVGFNSLVNTCIACHENLCPGPIVRIEKLLFKNVD